MYLGLAELMLEWRVMISAISLVAVGSCATTCKNLHNESGTYEKKYASRPAANYSACCDICAAAKPACGHFVWVPNVTEGCHLKHGSISTAGLLPQKGYVAGEAAAPPPPPPLPPLPPLPLPLGYRPHLVFFLADDWGHYNMGWRGNPEARTPNIDALVKEGVILDRHYVYQFCSPTRSALLSGRLPIHMNVRNMAPTALGGVDLRASTIADKLRGAGYRTHQVGKWNAGSLLYGQVPTERGFESSFGYMGGEEDHYTQVGGYGGEGGGREEESAYMPRELLEGPGFAAGDPRLVGGGEGGSDLVDLLDSGTPALGQNGTYGAFMYTARSVEIVMRHNASEPLFLYHAWQEAHTPNEVPDAFLSPEGAIDWPLRRTYEAMVHTMDSGVGNVSAALRARGLWPTTLVVMSSDNGGREDNAFGGNNWPLRGMKFTDFEGGTRVAAFVSGGVVPPARRGALEAGLMHVADWYCTFSLLAGVDPTDRKAAGGPVPPVDCLDMWATLARGAPSLRTELTLSQNAHIRWPHKVVLGKQGGKGVWTGPRHPNATAHPDDDAGCGATGCLFDIEVDPTEHADLARQRPALLANLSSALAAAWRWATRYQTGDDGFHGVYTNCTTLARYVEVYPGFGGPLCSAASAPAVGLVEESSRE